MAKLKPMVKQLQRLIELQKKERAAKKIEWETWMIHCKAQRVLEDIQDELGRLQDKEENS